MEDQSDMPVHLRDDASFLQCSECRRKSWSGEINSTCGMTQPSGNKCKGLLEGRKRGGQWVKVPNPAMSGPNMLEVFWKDGTSFPILTVTPNKFNGGIK